MFVEFAFVTCYISHQCKAARLEDADFVGILELA